ncbi:MAG: TIGR02391 family protein [Chloroflexi bacterium]|nr:TIGR02391 family protein [Chloroflexota bacterium]
MRLAEVRWAVEVATAIQEAANREGLGPATSPPVDPLARAVTDPDLLRVSKKLYADGHCAQAVEEAYKYLNNLVKSRSKLSATEIAQIKDGSALMKRVFSVSSPVLMLNRLKTDSQRNQQLGYMEILSGCMTGIRNPRAHEHGYLDEPSIALEILTWANHLVRVVKSAHRTPKPRKKAINQ